MRLLDIGHVLHVCSSTRSWVRTLTKLTYLAAHAHIRNRRGLPNAIGATRHDLLIADWHLMHDQVDYGDLARTAPSAATPPGAALAG